MEVEFASNDFDHLEIDPTFTAGLSRAVVRAFRKRMQTIRAAPDERTLYALKSLHFEKLKGKRSHQRSIRLTKKWRLVLELKKDGDKSVVVIVAIEDYH